MFESLVVDPWVYEPDPELFELKRWALNATYRNVSPIWIDQLSPLWFNGYPVPVSFYYRGQWCTGHGYIVSLSSSCELSPFSSVMQFHLSIEIHGAGHLTKGSLNGTTL